MPTNDPATSAPDDADPSASAPGGRARRWAIRIVVALVALVALGYGAIWIYANFINDPAEELTADDLRERLEAPADTTSGDTAPGGTASGDTVTDDTASGNGTAADDTAPGDDADPADASAATTTTPPTTAADTGSSASEVDGVWVATEASELGYRVTEILFGVDTEGVGRTNQVTGSLTIEGTSVTAAAFEVDMASVESDDSRRDGQFRGRLMTVVEYPTATFVLTEPIELGRIPDQGEQITADATGELTLRGVTNPVTFPVTAQLQNDRIGVLGNIRVVFADYGIVNPSIAGITTEDNGLLEFVLVFERG